MPSLIINYFFQIICTQASKKTSLKPELIDVAVKKSGKLLL